MKKWLCKLLATLTVFVMGVVPAFAAVIDPPVLPPAPGTELKEALIKAFTEMKGDVLGVIIAALPIGLLIYGAIFAIRKGKHAFNTISK